jgi:copper chaperone NosL
VVLHPGGWVQQVKAARGAVMKLGSFLARETKFFDLPLTLTSRILILVAVVALLPVYFFPLWNMSFYSNQYTDGLVLHIYSYQLEGGKTPNRDDLREINSLNHYIGMRPLLESDFSEFTWIPLVVGLLIILALRAMVLGKMSNLVDVFVMFVYFGAFSMWSFYHRLYMYAHNLDPTASIKVQPFTPPFFGSKQIANFTVNSFPGPGAYAFFAFAILLLVAIILSARRKNPKAQPASSLNQDV